MLGVRSVQWSALLWPDQHLIAPHGQLWHEAGSAWTYLRTKREDGVDEVKGAGEDEEDGYEEQEKAGGTYYV